jgi:hypothetical protein
MVNDGARGTGVRHPELVEGSLRREVDGVLIFNFQFSKKSETQGRGRITNILLNFKAIHL